VKDAPDMLYPLKFKPMLVEKIWGGRKLENVLGKRLPPDRPIGESWEIYDFPPGVVNGSTQWVSAAIANGPLAGRTLHDLMCKHRRELMGDVAPLPPHGQFPLLIKFLDAEENLSVQVHPPAEYAARHPGTHLKTEAWYILQADPGAMLWKGLAPGVTADELRRAIADGRVQQAIQSHPVKAGDFHYLPSGTVHALGKGILVAEVQTPSDTTFRIYDFDRIDPATGRPRTLHIEEALECISFDGQPPPQPRSHVASLFTTVTRLVSCPFFTIEKVRFAEGASQQVPYDQPVVWIMLQGEAKLDVGGLGQSVFFSRGDTLLLPARMDQPVLTTLSDCQWLEVTLPAGPANSD
jgi:mannose-6-phosphate isomerase